jgi:hypothetical protein
MVDKKLNHHGAIVMPCRKTVVLVDKVNPVRRTKAGLFETGPEVGLGSVRSMHQKFMKLHPAGRIHAQNSAIVGLDSIF